MINWPGNDFRHGLIVDVEPARALESLRGRVWKRIASKQELPQIERDHRLICTKLQAGRTVVLADGDAVGYDYLVYAVGSEPAPIGR